jgi:putative cardiolipin synthase
MDTINETDARPALILMRRTALRIAASAMLSLVFTLMVGCAALPADVRRPASQALVDEQTSLAQAAATAMPTTDAKQSGLRLIPDGDQALASRIALIRRAERSLDVQTYHLACDATGALFLSELRNAAARGVRVRLLVDDLYAARQDALYAALAAHANVEVRMFNPLPVREGSFGTRIALSLHEFSRVNRRMHNKLFIADGAFAIAGGRNIADEYYMRARRPTSSTWMCGRRCRGASCHRYSTATGTASRPIRSVR